MPIVSRCDHKLDRQSHEMQNAKVIVELSEIDLDKWFNPSKLAAQVSAGLLKYRKPRRK